MAASQQHKSIAFPAIGTGGLRFNKKEVAQIMLDAVTTFTQKSTQRMDVHFVIYPHDNETFQVVLQKCHHYMTVMLSYWLFVCTVGG